MRLLYFMLQAKDRELEDKVELKSKERGGGGLQNDHCQPRGSYNDKTWKRNILNQVLKAFKNLQDDHCQPRGAHNVET